MEPVLRPKAPKKKKKKNKKKPKTSDFQGSPWVSVGLRGSPWAALGFVEPLVPLTPIHGKIRQRGYMVSQGLYN